MPGEQLVADVEAGHRGGICARTTQAVMVVLMDSPLEWRVLVLAPNGRSR